MRRLDWMARGCAAFVVAIGGAAPVAMAEVRQAEAPPARTAPRQSQSRVVDQLSRLHHVAQREIELGQLAQVAALRPETVVFGRELETAFRALDGRIVAFAKLVGIAETRLRQADDVDNKIALRRQADMDRLATARGQNFDRLFWVMVAQDHLTASAYLASAAGVAGADRRVNALIADTALLLDKFGRQAGLTSASIDRP